MKTLLKIEELFLLLLAVYLFLQLDYSWWWLLILFLAPDLSMVGYLHNPQTGAWAYNLAHHKGVALAFYLIGALIGAQLLQLIGLVLFGHSSFDRIMSYGLKHPDSFQHTHLGMIGKAGQG